MAQLWARCWYWSSLLARASGFAAQRCDVHLAKWFLSHFVGGEQATPVTSSSSDLSMFLLRGKEASLCCQKPEFSSECQKSSPYHPHLPNSQLSPVNKLCPRRDGLVQLRDKILPHILPARRGTQCCSFCLAQTSHRKDKACHSFQVHSGSFSCEWAAFYHGSRQLPEHMGPWL